jgi:signal transduction histidine kinase
MARAEAEHALEQLRAVYAITDTVSTPASIGELLSELLRRLRETLQTDHASVMILDDATQSLYLRAIEGAEPGRTVPRMRIPLGAGVSGRIAAEGKPMIVDDYSTIDIASYERADLGQLAQTRSVMGAPFRIADRVAGVVVVSCQTPRKFTEEDLRLLLLAVDRVAPAIERGRLIASIRTGVDRQRALSRRLLTVQEDERRRIAVELHDELGQILTAVKINLESIERAPDPQQLATLPSMIKGVDDALQRVKDMALDLRPSVLDDLGLDAALRWFTDRCAQRAGFTAHLSVDTLPPLEANLQTACFRVTQEALTNVERHARARHVWIDLHVLDGALELSVRDDGAGFDVAAAKARAISGSSVGILGMQERVALTGGEYEIIQVASGGTEVRARFPLHGDLTN